MKRVEYITPADHENSSTPHLQYGILHSISHWWTTSTPSLQLQYGIVLVKTILLHLSGYLLLYLSICLPVLLCPCEGHTSPSILISVFYLSICLPVLLCPVEGHASPSIWISVSWSIYLSTSLTLSCWRPCLSCRWCIYLFLSLSICLLSYFVLVKAMLLYLNWYLFLYLSICLTLSWWRPCLSCRWCRWAGRRCTRAWHGISWLVYLKKSIVAKVWSKTNYFWNFINKINYFIYTARCYYII